MHKKIYIISVFLLLLFAVGGASGSETAVPDQPADALESDVKTVVAKPQLIEFYADW